MQHHADANDSKNRAVGVGCVREQELNRAGWVALLAVYVFWLLDVEVFSTPVPCLRQLRSAFKLWPPVWLLPLDLEQPNDGSGRLFIVEQGGTIKILQNGALLPQPFLNISNKVIFQGEMGLLGLTFHPGFQTNRKFYVNYVRNAGGQFQSVIAEYLASATNPNQADPASERILLVVDQISNFVNHKAGQLAFGPDGFLYFGLGDGGGAGDPFGHGQNTQTLLGKLMRIDVNSTSPDKPYAIPADNPFATRWTMISSRADAGVEER